MSQNIQNFRISADFWFHFRFYYVQLSPLRIFVCTLFTKNKSQRAITWVLLETVLRSLSVDKFEISWMETMEIGAIVFVSQNIRSQMQEQTVLPDLLDLLDLCQARRQKGYTIRKWLASRTLDTPLERPTTYHLLSHCVFPSSPPPPIVILLYENLPVKVECCPLQFLFQPVLSDFG